MSFGIIPVTPATITGLTNLGITYGGATGTLAQDTANFQYDQSAPRLTVLRYIDSVASPAIILSKSRGSSSVATTVVNGDNLGNILFNGYDGTAFLTVGNITGMVDAAVSTGIVPTRLTFGVAEPVGGVRTERLRINATGGIWNNPTLAVPAGGTAGIGYLFSSTVNLGIFWGSGAPTLQAAKGSLYLRTDATTNVTRAYINTDGGTTWTGMNTVA